MEKTLQELKTIIRELILEIGQLKERVTYLERASSQEQLQPELLPEPPSWPDIEVESYENLGRVYREGYHICPVAFGQKRDEECLFCLAFMEKE
ncbi:MAG: initiation control protein YabA [Syntrophomonas sp.]|uniref:initiation control protein YabA n=1 Tax=Syntrophomonas sp. TaxID=2053627 RepID=UPI002638CE99|nr:initiation control protein YabA [Syntrophomonas sp.]MDD2510545.1 initiation control protein YabA [Syntrophomonas sp.]MDD3879035.1 initiation control protein YabA [Syntrophomonas sp.]MDD4626366.1 initiation control protein YabA [Syntrophomonas sp.]